MAIVLVAVAVVALPATAFAYSTNPDIPCEACHGSSVPTPTVDSARGPHGGYSATTNNCQTCHSVHDAPDESVLLLPAATIKGTCLTCHDSTGGTGVYGTIASRGLSVEGSHSIEGTRVVPGGDAATGGSREETFTGQAFVLSCEDCHSPHGFQVVEAFSGDRWRSGAATPAPLSTKLLKQRPTGSETTVTVYGSDWCGSCHRGRISGGEVHTHPVDSSATTSSPFTYANVASVLSTTSLETTMGGLGGSNRGFVMPAPRTPKQEGHAPICQQCHEDARDVGVPGQVATYTVNTADGGDALGNPRFQDFPHESSAPSLLLETNDNLCTNCHPPAALP